MGGAQVLVLVTLMGTHWRWGPPLAPGPPLIVGSPVGGGPGRPPCRPINVTVALEKDECPQCMAVTTTACGGYCRTRAPVYRSGAGPPPQAACTYLGVRYERRALRGCPPGADPGLALPVPLRCGCARCPLAAADCGGGGGGAGALRGGGRPINRHPADPHLDPGDPPPWGPPSWGPSPWGPPTPTQRPLGTPNLGDPRLWGPPPQHPNLGYSRTPTPTLGTPPPWGPPTDPWGPPDLGDPHPDPGDPPPQHPNPGDTRTPTRDPGDPPTLGTPGPRPRTLGAPPPWGPLTPHPGPGDPRPWGDP
ncbi:LOW QUALITY PROTEIN: proline-rich protein HaeIII subfamily 1-like [Falco biarmicus]|uniref:LOW QUALITY PROTEIN: proline-rich protein HaeIII subfamily 1-like n=1 Tax=Falco biarmicus TaxID=345155 RepID=UPI0024BD1E8C|nr:LOW QUALITY PROTEIN: proline-rich protein HaeIII subfamily 1-like [Falco biarmicus]